MHRALTAPRERGASGCVLVGTPDFYSHFDFKHDPNLTLPGVPPEVFLALHFNEDTPKGEVTFHEAFTATA